MAGMGQIKRNLKLLEERRNQYLYYLGRLAYKAADEGKLQDPEMMQAYRTLKEIQEQTAYWEKALEQAKAAKRPRCPYCGTAVVKGAVYCPGCGRSIGAAPAVQTTARAHVPTPATAGTCPRCGASLEAGAAFCGRCGFRVAGQEPRQVSPPSPAGVAAAPPAPPRPAEEGTVPGEAEVGAGEETPPGAEEKVAAAPPAPPRPAEEGAVPGEAEEKETALFCPGCGGRVDDPEARFCPDCGTRLGEEK